MQSKANPDGAGVNFSSGGSESLGGQTLLSEFKQLVFLAADMPAQQSAERFEQVDGWGPAQLFHHVLYRTMISKQLSDDGQTIQFALNQRKQHLFLDGEMVRELDLITVENAARELLDCLGGTIGTQGAFGQNTQRKAVMVLLRKRDQRRVAEHNSIFQRFLTFMRAGSILSVCHFA